MPTVNLLKMPDPAAQTAKYVNMMNATKQLEAAERQASMAEKRNQREEDLQVPALAKAKTQAEAEELKYVMDFYTSSANVLANAKDPEQAMARGEQLKQQFTNPALQKRIDETIADLVSDPSRFEENRKRILIRTLDAKEQFAETHSDIFDLEGNLYNKKTSPIGAFPTEITPGVVTGPANTGAAPAPAPRTPTAPQAAAPNPFAPGYKPNSAAAPVNSLSLVVDSALETGVMAKADFDKLVSIAQPGSGPKLEAWARQHNITIAPNAPGVTDNQVRGAPATLPDQMAVSPMSYDGKTPPADFAVYRGQPMPSQTAGLAGAPPMQNTMAQYQVGQQIRGKNPSISPAPGVYGVPTGQVAATSQAQRPSPKEEADKKRATTQVEIEMAPALAKATKSAERTFQLKAEAPKERGVATRLIANIDDRINTIDRLLRNPERRSIVGRFEGNIPYLLQNETQADAQADFDRIKNTDTLTSLVEMKQDSPTGGSPVGNASNQDVLLVARGANSLIQTGSLSKFDSELMNIRRQLYNARVNAIKTYNDVYGDVVASDPRLRLTVPAISDRYLGSKGLGKKGTSTKVDYNNPLLKGMKR